MPRDYKTEAEKRVNRLDTLEREMLKQYFVKMFLNLRVSRELKAEAEGLVRKSADWTPWRGR